MFLSDSHFRVERLAGHGAQIPALVRNAWHTKLTHFPNRTFLEIDSIERGDYVWLQLAFVIIATLLRG